MCVFGGEKDESGLDCHVCLEMSPSLRLSPFPQYFFHIFPIVLFLFWRYRWPALLLAISAALFLGYLWWAQTHECVFSRVVMTQMGLMVKCAWT
jgi:hypothetical protein